MPSLITPGRKSWSFALWGLGCVSVLSTLSFTSELILQLTSYARCVIGSPRNRAHPVQVWSGNHPQAPELPGDRHYGRASTAWKGDTAARDQSCIVMQIGPPSVIPHTAHIVPHVFGKFDNGFADSPFYNGVRLLFGALVACQM